MFKLPIFDVYSFWIGFLTASVFWWIFFRIKGVFPFIRNWIREQMEVMRQQRLAGIGAHIRQATYKQAQQSHVAANLFPLSDILIPTHLIAPPSFIVHPDGPLVPSTIAGQVIPYIPDWPEVSAQFNVDQLTAAQALQNGADIAVIGEPGTGKTVCLAELAIQVTRQDPKVGNLTKYLPLLIHIVDLDLHQEQKQDVLNVLVKYVSGQVPILIAPRIANFFKELMRDGRVLFLIDGLDNLPDEELKSTVRFIAEIKEKYPENRFCVAASPEYIDGFFSLGFFPLAVASWKNQERELLIQKWSACWQGQIVPELSRKSDFIGVDPVLVANWMISEPGFYTPLDWTLKTWAIFAGDAIGPTQMDAVASFIMRTTERIIPQAALENFACDLVTKGLPAMAYSDLEALFNSYNPDQKPVFDSQDENVSQEPQAGKKSSRPKEKKISSGAAAINRLLETGILIEYEDRIGFIHPLIQGFLAGTNLDPKIAAQHFESEKWPVLDLSMRFLAAQNKITWWIKTQIYQEDFPTFHNLLRIARWMNSSDPKAEWRSMIMRQLVDFLQQDTLPYTQRLKFLGALVGSNDPSLPLLFKQLLGSASEEVRKMAALGAGSIRDAKVFNELIELFTDSNRDIRAAAALAVGSIGGPNSQRTLAEIILHGDEDLRQTAAEVLAADSGDGHTILKDAMEINDLLTRRAAIYGLTRIREEWVKPLLEKVAIEDSQWVVRNAASQALDEITHPLNSIPETLPAADQAGWLIKFASRHGTGIPKGDPGTELIVLAMASGNYSEKLAAMNYVLLNPKAGGIGDIYKLYYQEKGPMQEAAAYTIWLLSLTGFDLPHPAQFGL
jgi:hypothetical protein